jgi:hypothetical protein
MAGDVKPVFGMCASVRVGIAEPREWARNDQRV